MDEEWKPLSRPSRQSMIEGSLSWSASELEARKAVKVLLGCYRSGEASDPEVYTAAMTAVLRRYPPAIILAVVDPREGLPSASKFLPTVSEVRTECEKWQARQHRATQRAAELQQQLAERRAWKESRKMRPTYDDLKAMYGENWGLEFVPVKPKWQRPTDDELRAHYGTRKGG